MTGQIGMPEGLVVQPAGTEFGSGQSLQPGMDSCSLLALAAVQFDLSLPVAGTQPREGDESFLRSRRAFLELSWFPGSRRHPRPRVYR
jgi:hypothetical protein